MSVVVSLIVIVLIVAALKPTFFRYRRGTTILAPREKIFPLINDFHNWTTWSPWEHIDPTMQRTYSGAPAGVGTIYEWEGTGKAGQGRMEIMEASSPSTVKIKLNFIKPFVAQNTTDFILTPSANGTNVAWEMSGDQPYMMKVMTLFMSLDKMLGKDFDQGLANMKAAAEKA